VISLNLVLAGLRLGLKNRQVGEKWVSDDYSYLCKGLKLYNPDCIESITLYRYHEIFWCLDTPF
jgi:hypothetical protein